MIDCYSVKMNYYDNFLGKKDSKFFYKKTEEKFFNYVVKINEISNIIENNMSSTNILDLKNTVVDGMSIMSQLDFYAQRQGVNHYCDMDLSVMKKWSK